MPFSSLLSHFGTSSNPAANRRNRALRRRRLRFDVLESRRMLAANVVGDFDGDQIHDLAVGVPGELIDSVRAGAVNVIYGQSATGLTATDNQFWSQNSSGILGVSDDADEFGHALAAGDFNADGRDDLVVGIPGETVNSAVGAGAVVVIYGAAAGLSSAGNQLWTQDTSGILDFAEALDHFGASLAVGDFNGDGVDDLAIGAHLEDYARNNPIPGEDAGAVHIIYGAAGIGLTSANNQFWNLDSSGIIGQADGGEEFGFAFASGDFNNDGRDDLAIGAPGEVVNTMLDAGAVTVIYGSETGLASSGNQLWNQDSSGILDVAHQADSFGAALAAGDFDQDGRDDLAVGIPGEDVDAAVDAGAVAVIYGSESGLSSLRNQFWSQNSPDILEVAELGDSFGASVQAADFNNNGSDDLAIGVPGESFDTLDRTGAVNIIYGQVTTGLTSAGNQRWNENLFGSKLSVAVNDLFGSTLGVGDFNGDGFFDLVISIPNRRVTSLSSTGPSFFKAGAVLVVPGSASGTTTDRGIVQIWHQNVSGILDEAEADEAFGASLISSTLLPF